MQTPLRYMGFLPKTAWKWKKLDQEGSTLLYHPMVFANGNISVCKREFSIFLCSWHQIFIYYPIENNEPSFPLITTNTLTPLWPGLIYGLLTRSLVSFLSQLLLNICCVIFADVTVLCAMKNQPFDFSKNSFPYLQEVTWLSQYLTAVFYP